MDEMNGMIDQEANNGEQADAMGGDATSKMAMEAAM